MNRWSGAGRLTKDPRVTYTQAGVPRAAFTLAARKVAREGQEDADFIPCIAWSKTAELVQSYLFKGSQAAIDGRLQSRSWVGPDGAKKYAVEVVVEHIDFMGPYSGEKTIVPMDL